MSDETCTITHSVVLGPNALDWFRNSSTRLLIPRFALPHLRPGVRIRLSLEDGTHVMFVAREEHFELPPPDSAQRMLNLMSRVVQIDFADDPPGAATSAVRSAAFMRFW